MRRSLAIRSSLVSALIVLVFVIPLGIAVRALARERALTFARSDARALAPIVSLAGNPNVPGTLVAVGQRARPRVVTVVFSDGSVLGSGEVVEPDPFYDEEALQRARDGRAFARSRRGGVVVYEPVPRSNGSVAVVRVFVPNRQLHRGVTTAWIALGGIGVFLVGLAVLVSDRIGRSVVQSVHRLAESANRLGRGSPERVSPSGPPEVREVGVALNNLTDRIEELLHTERAAVADLQHQLRTPVTALRAEVGSLPLSEERRRLEGGLEALTGTIDDIIRNAANPIRRGIGITTDLALTVRRRFEFWEVLAEDQKRRSDIDVPEGSLLVSVIEGEVTTIIDVLIDNVFSHTAEGVGFAVRVRPVEGFVELRVEDDGPGVPIGFDPIRGESSRGSTGLGLDIVRRTVAASGGTFEIGNRPSGGTAVVLRLPLV